MVGAGFFRERVKAFAFFVAQRNGVIKTCGAATEAGIDFLRVVCAHAQLYARVEAFAAFARKI